MILQVLSWLALVMRKPWQIFFVISVSFLFAAPQAHQQYQRTYTADRQYDGGVRQFFGQGDFFNSQVQEAAGVVTVTLDGGGQPEDEDHRERFSFTDPGARSGIHGGSGFSAFSRAQFRFG
jgi:hypothetical protein